jgi:hypothetical protein
LLPFICGVNGLALADLELQVRGQVGQKPAARVVGRHLDRVGDHLLRHGRVESNPAHGAGECFAGVSVHGECHVLTDGDLADVRFVDRRPHSHLA